MTRDRWITIGVAAAVCVAALGYSQTRVRSAVRAQIDAGIRADRIQRDLDETKANLAATVVAHAALRHRTDSADAELAKAKARAQRTTATLVAFRDSVGQLPPPSTASDSVRWLSGHIELLRADDIAKNDALEKADSVIAGLRNETALLHGAVTSALARLDSTATNHAAHIAKTKDWGPPPSLFDKARDTSIALAAGYLIGKATR